MNKDTLTDYQKELVVNAIAEFNSANGEVIIAIGNNAEANQLADLIRSFAANDLPIKLHQPENARSWNECLQIQIQIQHDRALLQLAEQKSTQNKRSQLEP